MEFTQKTKIANGYTQTDAMTARIIFQTRLSRKIKTDRMNCRVRVYCDQLR